MAYRNRGTQYDTNPFAQLQPLPYISQRVDEGFINDKLSALQLIEQQRQQSLADSDTIALALGNIEATGDNAKAKLGEIETKLRGELDSFGGGKYGFADPNMRDKLRRVAKDFYTNKDLKHITNFTAASKADALKRQDAIQNGKFLMNIGDTSNDAFDEEGNQRNFQSGWVVDPGVDEARQKAITQGFNDVVSTMNLAELNAQALTSGDSYLAKNTVTSNRQAIDDKFNEVFDMYYNSNEGQLEKQNIMYENGYEDEADAIADMQDRFRNDAIALSKTNKEYGLIGNVAFDKTGGGGGDISLDSIPSSGEKGESNLSFTSKEALKDQKIDDSPKGILKQSIISSLDQDPDLIEQRNNVTEFFGKDKVNEKYQELFNLISEDFLSNGSKYENLDASKLENIILTTIDSIVDPLAGAAVDTYTGILNPILKVFGKEEIVQEDDDKVVLSKIRDLKKSLKDDPNFDGFKKVTTDYFKKQDELLNDYIETGMEFRAYKLNPEGEGYSKKQNAIKNHVRDINIDGDVKLSSELEDKEILEDIPSVIREGNKLIYNFRTNQGRLVKGTITDNDIRNNVINSIGRESYRIANDYKDFKGVTTDGTEFIIGDQKIKLPKDKKIVKKKINGKIMYGIADRNLDVSKYDLASLSEQEKDRIFEPFEYYFDNNNTPQEVNFVPYKDLFYIANFLRNK